MKLSFFARIYLAITDFRLYPYIAQKEKFITALAYFLGFIILITAILATGITSNAIKWTGEFTASYDTLVNEFAINNGVFDVSGENMDFDFMGVKIFTDDNKGYEEFDFDSLDVEDYSFSVIGLKDTMAFGNSNGLVLAKYTEEFNTNKDEVYKVLNYLIQSPIAKLSVAGMTFGAVFVAYLFTKFINVIGITVMIMFLGFLFRTKYKFKDYMKVAFYVITLPVIIEVIALMVTGNINEYAYITYYLLLYIYMYYAVRALKLDNIIMVAHEKIMGMKKYDDILNQKQEKEEQKDETKSDDKEDKNE